MKSNPHFRQQLFASAALNGAAATQQVTFYKPLQNLARALIHPISTLCIRLGIHPLTPLMFLKFGRKGGFISYVRRTTGLGKLPPKGSAVENTDA